MVLMFLVHYSLPAVSSERPDASVIEDRLAGEDVPEAQLEFLHEVWSNLFLEPVNINDPGELRGLTEFYLLSERQWRLIVNHRRQYGNFVSAYELIAVEGIDRQMVRELLPFIIAEEPESQDLSTIGRDLMSGDGEVVVRYTLSPEAIAGYRDGESAYYGPPGQEYIRVNYRDGTNYSYGITATRQSGEPYSGEWRRPIFPFYSAHLYLSGLNNPESIALGDYHLMFGQGLVLWTGFGFGMSGNISQLSAAGRGIRPYRSRGRYNFLRGAAASFRFRTLEITPFVSYKQVHATIHHEEPESHFRSIDLSGYGRTEAEQRRRNSTREVLAGGNLRYEGGHIGLGATFKWTRFGYPYRPGERVSSYFEPEGQHMLYASIDYNWDYRGVHGFGETAWQKGGGLAHLHGITLSPDPALDAGLIFRHYASGYRPFYSNAFRQGSKPANEKGLFFILGWHPATEWEIRAYADHFRHPWTGFQRSRPEAGQEYRLEVRHDSRNNQWSARYAFRKKAKDIPGSNKTVHYKHHRINMRLRHDLTEDWQTGGGLSASFRKEHAGMLPHGWAIYNEWLYRTTGNWDFTFRYTLFDAEAFDNRITLYEHDVLYTFSMPFLMNTGSRWYLLIKKSIGRNWDFWVRAGRTRYFGVSSVGSEENDVDKPSETNLRVQVRYTW